MSVPYIWQVTQAVKRAVCKTVIVSSTLTLASKCYIIIYQPLIKHPSGAFIYICTQVLTMFFYNDIIYLESS